MMSHRNVAHQHKVAEVVCDRLEMAVRGSAHPVSDLGLTKKRKWVRGGIRKDGKLKTELSLAQVVGTRQHCQRLLRCTAVSLCRTMRGSAVPSIV